MTYQVIGQAPNCRTKYAFDDIGNRTSTKEGGDEGGAGLRSASYTANSLNQYTSRDVPEAIDVLGIAHPNASVTVNGQSAYRRGEYFWKELAVNNASAAVWQGVTNTAVATNLTNSVVGNVFVPKKPETFAYDADGNLTNDGRFRYIWDAENRLIGMESFSSAPTASQRKLIFGYDSQSRRISKVVSNLVAGAWAQLSDERFAYDGWNLLAVLNSQPSILKSFLWGIDLSGSLQGAGGVGGLLAVNGGTNGVHFACYDGNGNLTALVSGANGVVTARYEYGAFGELIRASGLMAKANPFRFSTKYQDDESDFLYYGYRSYNSSLGRWLNRDRLGEHAGENIYLFNANDALRHVDLLGNEVYHSIHLVMALKGTAGGATASRFDLVLGCVCMPGGGGNFTLFVSQFDLHIKTMIAMYSGGTEANPAHRRYTMGHMYRVVQHEKKHYRHDVNWYNYYNPIVRAEHLKTYTLAACEDKTAALEDEITQAWYAHYMADMWHTSDAFSDWSNWPAEQAANPPEYQPDSFDYNGEIPGQTNPPDAIDPLGEVDQGMLQTWWSAIE